MTPTQPWSEELGIPAALLLDRPQQPYWAHRGRFPAEQYRAFSLARAGQVLKTRGASTHVIRNGSGPAALACWVPLEWDSQQYGFPAARLDLLLAKGEYAEARRRKHELLRAIVEDCRHRGVRHMIARVDAGDFSAIHALQDAGFELIDGIQTFALELRELPEEPPAPGIEVRPSRPEDMDGICRIARTSYVHDRFHADTALAPGKADEINETWLRNSCLGKAADCVMVAADGEGVLSYVTCKLDHDARKALGTGFGTIVMVATDARARGRGLARHATHGALEWFRRQGAAVVEVGTQLRNVAAGRLYENCGFRLAGVSLTYRRII